MKNKIIILQRIIPHYRTGFFKKFTETFENTCILYGQPAKNESLKNSENLPGNNFINCSNYYLNKSGSIFASGIYSKLFSYEPEIVITGINVGNINIYILFLLRIFRRYKIILWSFGYEPKSGFDPEKSFLDRVRLFFYRRADAVVFYWKTGRDEVSKYSRKTEHYFIAPNTLDTGQLTEMKEKFDIEGVIKIKQDLSVKEKFHFVYIGRFLEDKQVDLLLTAYSIVEKENKDCRLTLIGDGPEKLKLEELSSELQLKTVHFAGEIFDEEITGKWIYISDAFVMPGRLGLSVVHSFCFATPVISQKKDKHFHGEGIGYIKDGVNGILVEDGNAKKFAEEMITIISNPVHLKSLKENSFQTAKDDCSMQNMINGFKQAIEYTMN